MGVAIPAQRILLLFVVRSVTHILKGENCAAAITSGIAAVIAPLAERGIAVPSVIVVADSFAAGTAHYGFLLQTVGTNGFSVYLMTLGERILHVAAGTDKGVFFHGILPPEFFNPWLPQGISGG